MVSFRSEEEIPIETFRISQNVKQFQQNPSESQIISIESIKISVNPNTFLQSPSKSQRIPTQSFRILHNVKKNLNRIHRNVKESLKISVNPNIILQNLKKTQIGSFKVLQNVKESNRILHDPSVNPNIVLQNLKKDPTTRILNTPKSSTIIKTQRSMTSDAIPDAGINPPLKMPFTALNDPLNSSTNPTVQTTSTTSFPNPTNPTPFASHQTSPNRHPAE